jgi:hypothetical protein
VESLSGELVIGRKHPAHPPQTTCYLW